ncbi:pali-domain-containing protein [Cutaneotrichosporon oleaginosum]|uniref:Pali-domain-containing protein n=1 Tax=Cutaneotrichosporon oleaginosum TaxID=879819 RepID=A0A0J0XN35_9TREE|nr:pali-domain-containing protein [Cutaneotrichosporon oleaginosum]KLT42502.1 pali-domain-containing protein [Cutaneotrichosporon oleaginosum]
MPSPAFPGMFLAFAAAVLLLFASISPPVWERVSFLNVETPAGRNVYGVFGLCLKATERLCTRRSIGYNLQAQGLDNTLIQMNSDILHNLSKTLILHPIAGALSFLAFLCGLIGVACASRAATIMMALLSFLGALAGLVIFVIDMVLWNVLKNRVNDAGYNATLGNANWFTVGAVAAMIMAMCASFFGACGRFATGRAAGEKY